MALTKTLQVRIIICSAIGKRDDMMHMFRRRRPAFPQAHLAQRVCGEKGAPDARPRPIIAAFHLRRASIAVILRRYNLLVRRAVLPFGQLRAARIAAGMAGFSRHDSLRERKSPRRIAPGGLRHIL